MCLMVQDYIRAKRIYRRVERHEFCEHCDGGRKVRHDDLRGAVCPSCDRALDALFRKAPKRMTQ